MHLYFITFGLVLTIGYIIGVLTIILSSRTCELDY